MPRSTVSWRFCPCAQFKFRAAAFVLLPFIHGEEIYKIEITIGWKSGNIDPLNTRLGAPITTRS